MIFWKIAFHVAINKTSLKVFAHEFQGLFHSIAWKTAEIKYSETQYLSRIQNRMEIWIAKYRSAASLLCTIILKLDQFGYVLIIFISGHKLSAYHMGPHISLPPLLRIHIAANYVTIFTHLSTDWVCDGQSRSSMGLATWLQLSLGCRSVGDQSLQSSSHLGQRGRWHQGWHEEFS